MKNIAWVGLVLFFTALLTHTVANPDIWYHLALARRIIVARSFFPHEMVRLAPPNYVNFYWLFQLISLASYKVLECFGLLILFWLLWTSLFFIWSRLSKINPAESWTSIVFAILALLICQIRFQERPEVFSFLFIMLDLYILCRWKDPYDLKEILWCLTLVQILWCNSHGYFIFGPAILLLKAIGIFLETRNFKTAARTLAGVLALVIASMISPFGWNTWRAFAEQWFYLSVGSPWITEIYSTPALGLTPWTLFFFWIYWAVTVVLCVFQIKNWRRHFFQITLAVTGLYFSFTAVRNVPLLVFFSAPLFGEFEFSKFKNKGLKFASLIIVLLLTLWTVTGGFFRSTLQPFKFGVGVSDLMFPVKLRDQPLATEGLWFCDGTTGSYLEFFKPDLRLYGDTRYMGSESIEYFQTVSEPEVFSQVNARERFSHAVLDVGRSTEVIRVLLHDGKWKLTYRDLTTAIFDNVITQGHGAQDSDIARAKRAPIFQGEDLSELANGNAAIQWTLIFAESNAERDLIGFLSELQSSPVVPSPILEIALAYLKAHPQGDVLEKIWALRPKMMALTPEAAILVDQKLASIKTGEFWASP